MTENGRNRGRKEEEILRFQEAENDGGDLVIGKLTLVLVETR